MRRILFVDDHPIYRDGFRRALSDLSGEIVVVDVSGIGEARHTLLRNSEFDLCLVDKKLADGDGLAFAAEIRRSYPTIAVGLLSAAMSPDLAVAMRRIGGVACLAKSRDAASLRSAIEALFLGELVFDEDGASEIAKIEVSRRKQEVLTLASLGMQDKQIGRRLEISESTVRHHWKKIFDLLGASNRAEAVSKAHQSGLLSASDPQKNAPPK